jgi:O-antigen ligase
MPPKLTLIEKLSLLSVFVVTIIFIPRFWDPTVFPKVAVATVLGTLALYLAIKTLLYEQTIKSKVLVSAFSLLVLLGLISTLISEDLFTGFFGISARSNGLFGFHISLSFLLIGAAIKARSFPSRLYWLFSLLSLGQAVLGIAQDRGFQLIAAKNLYSPILGTFGNPNFLSAFLGFGLISSLFLFREKKSFRIRLFLAVNIFLCLFVIVKSQSIQGLFMFAVGISILCLGIAINRGIIWINLWALSLITLTSLSISGLLGRGPLGSLLYQESTFYRFDYWRIAYRTIIDRPIFGVGPDQFAYSYITYRDPASVTRETNIVVDSAHNMFLQVGATFGLPYLLILLALFTWITFLSIKKFLLDRDRTVNYEIALLALWVSFLVQTTISVDTISALVPGFLIGGLLFSHANAEVKKDEIKKVASGKNTTKTSLPILPAAICILLSISILLPPFNMFRVTSEVRDKYSSPGTRLSLSEINSLLWLSRLVGNGDRYLWSRIANFRYGSGDVETARSILSQARLDFPNYPTIIDFQAQLAVTENRPADALALRERIYSIDKINILNIREILTLCKQLEDRFRFEKYLAIGKSINSQYFANIETNW